MGPDIISANRHDRRGRVVSLRPVGDDWRAVADVAPLDAQRDFVPALAARYLLLSDRESDWTSLAVYAGGEVVGHVMWGIDEDGSRWIGGLLIDGREQGLGLGRAVTETLVGWLAAQPSCWTVRLSYDPANTVAAHLYTTLGFVPTGEVEDGEVVVECPVDPRGPSRTGPAP